MYPEEEITAIADTIIALEEPAPYSDEEKETFYQAAKFFKEWAEAAFLAPDEALEEYGDTREEVIEAAQPIMAVSIELVRMAAGSHSTIGRQALQNHVRELGKMALQGLANIQMEMMGHPTHPSHGEAFEPDEDPEGRGFY